MNDVYHGLSLQRHSRERTPSSFLERPVTFRLITVAVLNPPSQQRAPLMWSELPGRWGVHIREGPLCLWFWGNAALGTPFRISGPNTSPGPEENQSVLGCWEISWLNKELLSTTINLGGSHIYRINPVKHCDYFTKDNANTRMLMSEKLLYASLTVVIAYDKPNGTMWLFHKRRIIRIPDHYCYFIPHMLGLGLHFEYANSIRYVSLVRISKHRINVADNVSKLISWRVTWPKRRLKTYTISLLY